MSPLNAVFLLLGVQAVTGWNWIFTNAHNLNGAVEGDDFFVGNPRHANHISRKLKLKLEETVVEESSTKEEEIEHRCSPSSPCHLGQFCDRHYALCRPLRQAGETCRDDSHCVDGFDCMFGRCLPHVPQGEQGARCSPTAPSCGAEQCCARQHGEWVCKPKLNLGQRCYVPEGGLAYSINQMCPCQDGLLCRGRPKGNDGSWLTPWIQQRSYRCVPK